MNLDPRGKAKLGRVIRYGTVALIAAWSLVALAIYAVLGTVAGWMTAQGMAEGWIAWSGHLVGQAGGAAVAILWLAGMFVILGAMAVIRVNGHRSFPDCGLLNSPDRRRVWGR